MTLLGALGAFVTWFLSVPAARKFAEDMSLMIWSEMWGRNLSDPKFRAQYDPLCVQLAATTDPKMKQAILQKIQELRKAGS